MMRGQARRKGKAIQKEAVKGGEGEAEDERQGEEYEMVCCCFFVGSCDWNLVLELNRYLRKHCKNIIDPTTVGLYIYS
jgi:hypothetical protein